MIYFFIYYYYFFLYYDQLQQSKLGNGPRPRFEGIVIQKNVVT